MANLNRIILVGKLTADPETRETMDGRPMAKFSLTVDRPQGGADLIDVIAWAKAAEISRDYLQKGKLALIEGRIQIRAFEDQTGQRRWATEVVANKVRAFDHPGVTSDDTDLVSELPF